MMYAKIYPEGTKGGRGKKNLEDSSTFSNKRLQQARSVLRLATKYDAVQVVESVVKGDMGLADAMLIPRCEENE